MLVQGLGLCCPRPSSCFNLLGVSNLPSSCLPLAWIVPAPLVGTGGGSFAFPCLKLFLLEALAKKLHGVD